MRSSGAGTGAGQGPRGRAGGLSWALGCLLAFPAVPAALGAGRGIRPEDLRPVRQGVDPARDRKIVSQEQYLAWALGEPSPIRPGPDGFPVAERDGGVELVDTRFLGEPDEGARIEAFASLACRIEAALQPRPASFEPGEARRRLHRLIARLHPAEYARITGTGVEPGSAIRGSRSTGDGVAAGGGGLASAGAGAGSGRAGQRWRGGATSSGNRPGGSSRSTGPGRAREWTGRPPSRSTASPGDTRRPAARPSLPPPPPPPPAPPARVQAPRAPAGARVPWTFLAGLALLGAIGAFILRARREDPVPGGTRPAGRAVDLTGLLDPVDRHLDREGLGAVGDRAASQLDWLKAMRYGFATLLLDLTRARRLEVQDWQTNLEIAGLLTGRQQLAESFWAAATVFELFFFGQRVPTESDFSLFMTLADDCRKTMEPGGPA